MSATRDKSQKVGFVYANMYQIYKNAPAAQPGLTSGQVIKAKDASAIPSAEPVAAVRISPFKPVELLGKRFETKRVDLPRNLAVDGLRKNLEKLTELHARLRFMLQELEELVKE